MCVLLKHVWYVMHDEQGVKLVIMYTCVCVLLGISQCMCNTYQSMSDCIMITFIIHTFSSIQYPVISYLVPYKILWYVVLSKGKMETKVFDLYLNLPSCWFSEGFPQSKYSFVLRVRWEDRCHYHGSLIWSWSRLARLSMA